MLRGDDGELTSGQSGGNAAQGLGPGRQWNLLPLTPLFMAGKDGDALRPGYRGWHPYKSRAEGFEGLGD
jgi:hypothetical protein